MPRVSCRHNRKRLAVSTTRNRRTNAVRRRPFAAALPPHTPVKHYALDARCNSLDRLKGYTCNEHACNVARRPLYLLIEPCRGAPSRKNRKLYAQRAGIWPRLQPFVAYDSVVLNSSSPSRPLLDLLPRSMSSPDSNMANFCRATRSRAVSHAKGHRENLNTDSSDLGTEHSLQAEAPEACTQEIARLEKPTGGLH